MQDKNFIVWEWEDDNLVWIPYKSNVSNYIDESFGKKEMKVFLKNIDSSLSAFTLDLMTNKQISVIGRCRNIRRSHYSQLNSLSKNISWLWLGDGVKHWNVYSVAMTEFLEKNFQDNLKSVNLNVPPFNLNYTINFATMSQRNNISGFERSVHRSSYDIPYITVPENSDLKNKFGNTVAGFSHPKSFNSANFPSTSTGNGYLQTPSQFPSFQSHLSNDPKINNFNSNNKNKNKKHRVDMKNSQKRFHMVKSDEINQINLLANKGEMKINSLEKFMIPINPRVCQNEDCCICCDSLNNASSFLGEDNDDDDGAKVIKLYKCSHMFHYNCLSAMYNSGKKDGSIQCPSCKYIYGIKYGDCPDGSMKYEILNNNSLSGYPDCGVIKITYYITNGIQESYHPFPGQLYTASGFPRYGYLPHNQDGLKILKLLELAWYRRLTFTIGTSVTTGRKNVVVWNEIHHKTEMDNHSGHGYPDPGYLNNVTEELAAHGVLKEDDEEL